MKTLLQFGAGKIGRSFIAQIFSRSGFRIIFIDIDPCVVNSINERGSYKVVIQENSGATEEYTVKNISALEITSTKNVIHAIRDADIISVSVGKRSLVKLAPVFARGIKDRYQFRKDAPVDIILAENVKDAASLLSKEIARRIPNVPLNEYVGFVETSIGKMVPLMTQEQLKEDPLCVYAEPYNYLILDAKAFRADIPEVPEIAPKSNMAAWVDRKLFLHNLGHAVLAYQCNYFYPEILYTWQALEKSDIFQITRDTMKQSAMILHQMYPDEFSVHQLDIHVEELLKRIASKSLRDTIFRIGCDAGRKLGRDDRLMKPILKAIELQMDYDLILEAWIRGCYFNARDEKGKLHPEDRKFKQKFNSDPILILREHCKFDPAKDSSILNETENILKKINSSNK